MLGKLAVGVALLALISGCAFGQSSPNWANGYVPTPAQWNAEWASKQDYIGPLGNGATLNIGTTAGTLAAGNDPRIIGAVQAANNGTDFANLAVTLSNLGGVTAAQAAADAPVQSVAGKTGAVTLSASNISGVLASANNLSDLASAPTADANLGLGTTSSPVFGGLTVNGTKSGIKTLTYSGAADGAGTAVNSPYQYHFIENGTSSDNGAYFGSEIYYDNNLQQPNNNFGASFTWNQRLNQTGPTSIGSVVTGWFGLNQAASGLNATGCGWNSVVTSGDAPSGSSTITVKAVGQWMVVGMVIFGGGIPANDTISNISGKIITLTTATTADTPSGTVLTAGKNLITTADAPSGTAVLTFASTASLSVGEVIGGSTNIPANDVIISMTSTTVTLSANTTGDVPSGSIIQPAGMPCLPGGYALEASTTYAYQDAPSASFVSTFSSGATSIPVSSVSGGPLLSGMYINCVGIPYGTIGYSSYPISSLTLSQAATASETGVTCYAGMPGDRTWAAIIGDQLNLGSATAPPFFAAGVGLEIDIRQQSGVLSARRRGLQFDVQPDGQPAVGGLRANDGAIFFGTTDSTLTTSLLQSAIAFSDAFDNLAVDPTGWFMQVGVPAAAKSSPISVAGALNGDGVEYTDRFLSEQGWGVDGTGNENLGAYYVNPNRVAHGLAIEPGYYIASATVASGGTACPTGTPAPCGFKTNDIFYGQFHDIWLGHANSSGVLTSVSLYEGAVGYTDQTPLPATETLTPWANASGLGTVTLNLTWAQASGGINLNSGSGPLTFGGAGSFTANGSGAVSLTSLAPAGAHSTVQEWLTITDASGVVRYIPAF